MSGYYSPKIMPPKWKMIKVIMSYGKLEFKKDDSGDSCRFNVSNDIPVWVPFWCAYGSVSDDSYGDPGVNVVETPLEEIYRYLFAEVWDMVEKINEVNRANR